MSRILKGLQKFSREKADYLLSYCLVVIPRIVFVSLFVYPMYITGDELFLFYLPAKLAGLDWSSSTASYRYYGYGFSVLLTPLFKLIENPVSLYRVILIIVSLIEGIIPIICCFLLKKILGLTDKKVIVPIAVSCSYAVSVSIGYMYNEHIYTVCIWGCFLWIALLVKHDENREKKIKYSILLALNMVLALSVHQRAITLLIGFVCLYIIILFLYKKKIGHIWLVVPIYLAGSWIDRGIMSEIISFLKDTGENAVVGAVQNTAVDFSVSKIGLIDLEYIQAMARIGISQINVWNFATAGFGCLSLILVLYCLVQKIYRKDRKENMWVCVFGIFGLSCIAVTIAGQALSWGGGVKEAWISDNSRADALRALVYLRYLYAYFPPVLMVVLAYICKHRSVSLKLFRCNVLCTIMLMAIWLQDIVPFIQNSRSLVPKAWSFTCFKDTEITIISYLTVILVILSCVILLFWLLEIGKVKIVMVVGSLFFLYYYFFNAFEADSATARHNYSYADASYKMIQELKDSSVEHCVYVRADSIPRSWQGRLYQVQFMNARVKLQRGIPDASVNEVIYLTIAPEKDIQLLEQGYVLYVLDDNEYAYVKGLNIEKYMKNSGRKVANVQ